MAGGGSSPSAAALLVQLKVESEFEECLEVKWSLANCSSELTDSTLEMVLDRSQGKGDGPLEPAKDAMVKRVPMGKQTTGSVQNMPEGRSFLIAIAGKLRDGRQVRSPWVRAATLHPRTRDPGMGNLDPMSQPRKGCKLCPCLCYVAQKWELNSAHKLRCRRCGCAYTDHLVVEADEILKTKEAKALKKLNRKDGIKPLPREALEWDERECSIWFMSDGLFHPRETVGWHREPLSDAAKARPGGTEGTAGKKGRVSVMTPTIESRQKFHQSLWECFVAQEWPDKELVVVETFVDQHSRFLAEMAEKDSRLVYVGYKRKKGADWSIGLKRNMCAHLASGEFIANFDDDDLYAPSYLSTMVPQLKDRSAHAVTLSSWYIYDTRSLKWGFCDAIAWGWQKGMDGEHGDVKAWAYGYGFSFVHRRQDLMDQPYDDINMGEDYSFFSRVLSKNGEKSVHLFHDEFGICLHTQHGANTSNAFPVRDVSYKEAGDLDVADLPRSVVRDCLTEPGKEEPAPGRGHRSLVAHTAKGDVHVLCTAGVTVQEFLRLLSLQQGQEDCTPNNVKVFRVPLLGLAEAPGQGSDEWLAEILGFELEERFGEEVSNEAASRVLAQKMRMLAKARSAMHIRERISLRVRDLWVVPAAAVEDPNEELDYGEDTESFSVEVTVQKTDAKSYFRVGHCIQARVPVGATVAALRELLGGDLPRRARVLAERPGKDPLPLRDDETLPSRVTVTEFQGQGRRTFYMRFTHGQCQTALLFMRELFRKSYMQRKLDDLEKGARVHSDTRAAEAEYRGQLSSLLANEVYPPMFRYFGMPEGNQGYRTFVDAMSQVTARRELAELWLEVELLMRNSTNITQARAALEAFQEEGAEASKP